MMHTILFLNRWLDGMHPLTFRLCMIDQAIPEQHPARPDLLPPSPSPPLLDQQHHQPPEQQQQRQYHASSTSHTVAATAQPYLAMSAAATGVQAHAQQQPRGAQQQRQHQQQSHEHPQHAIQASAVHHPPQPVPQQRALERPPRLAEQPHGYSSGYVQQTHVQVSVGAPPVMPSPPSTAWVSSCP